MNDMNKALDRRSGFRLERWLKVRAPAPSRPLEFKRQEDLEAWIAAWIGDKLRLDPDTLDRAAGVTDFGLDSLAAIELSAALEGVLGHAVSPGAAWEHASIRQLAEHLLSEEGPSQHDMDA